MNRRGASAIEFGLWLPILATTLSATVDLGWAMWTKQLVENASREGARAGSRVTKSPGTSNAATEADIETAALAQATRLLSEQNVNCPADCRVTATWFTDTVTGYEMLTVGVTYDYSPLIGVLPSLFTDMHADFTVMTLLQV